MTDMTDTKDRTSRAAQTLAKLGASKGGIARAKSLTPEQRSEIARIAVEARWRSAGKLENIVQATHTGELQIGDKVIPCAVLEDGTRVLTQWGFLKAIGRSGRPAAGRGSDVEKIAPFLALENLKPYVDNVLSDSTKPIVFRTSRGGKAYGYKAELLPRVCEVYLKARDEGVLLRSQENFARACDLLMRGLAHIGIVALVDEATGYQDARAKDALSKILEAFIAKELRKWVSTFPVDYYKELFRLRGWKFPELPADQKKRPVIVGKITTDIVYDRLAPGVRQELYRLTPRDEKGRLKHRLHQRLTEEIGHPKLREHLASVVTLMRISDQWDQFMQLLNRALPRYGDTPYLPFEDK